MFCTSSMIIITILYLKYVYIFFSLTYMMCNYLWQLSQSMKNFKQQGKEYIKAVYCHPAYLTYLQNTSWETLGWKKRKLEPRLPGEMSATSETQMIPL